MTLLEAILKENLDKVIELLVKEPSLIDDLDDSDVPLSFVAAMTGNLDIVKYIVEYSRASMNVTDTKHRNILHYCALSGNAEMARYLVERVGMSPTSADKDLITPFELAKLMGFDEMVSFFETICGARFEEMYKNPIRTGMFPDPSIVRVGEDYYMVNSSFIYFPCIPISHSRDLIHWQIIGHAITNPKWAMLDDLEGGRGYWAPDISYYEGRFYITATYRLNDTGTVYRKQTVVSSGKPEGPYTKPALIDEDGIDPSIFNDDDGRRYMLLNRGARIFELDKTGTKQISEAQLLYYGSQKRAPEGPHLLKKDGWYYLFLAEGGTGPGHRITVARSRELMGKYEPCPYNPIMRQTDKEAAIQRCGHGKPVMTQHGDWYMVYLCGRMIGDGYSLLGRETALDRIDWTEDGWPIVNNLEGPSALNVRPKLGNAGLKENSASDDMEGSYSTYYDSFSSTELNKEWMFPRPPEPDGYHLDGHKLWLKGSVHPLSSKDARNILVRRQKDFKFTSQTKLNVMSMTTQQDYGMICYYDENTWVTFGVHYNNEGRYCLRVIEHIGQEDIETIQPVPLDVEQFNEVLPGIELRIETDYLKRTFLYSLDGHSYSTVGVLNNVYYLCDEGIKMGKRFTGAMIGLYAYAGDEVLRIPFHYFNYDPVK